MMHLLIQVDAGHYRTAVRKLATGRGIWFPPFCTPTPDPGVQRLEISVGDATVQFTPAEAADVFASLIAS
jgi:hypothetical protein